MDSERCAECAQWCIAHNNGGIAGRSLLAVRPIAQGDTILTEPHTLWHCDVDPTFNGELSAINRAATMEAAYRQLLRQVAASLYVQADSASPSNSTIEARQRFEQLHCVSEAAFVDRHAVDDEQGRAESLRAVAMAKEVFAAFQLACSSCASACSPSSASSGLKLCATEADFVSALIRFQLNAWSFAVPSQHQTRINIVPHIAAANHSCCPNSVVMEGRCIVALRDIAADEPIMLSYLGLAALRSMDTAERRKRLWNGWIFRCECARCASTTATEEGSVAQQAWDRELQEIESAAAKLAPTAATSDDAQEGSASSSEED